MQEHGFKIGNQRNGELLINDWAKKDFRSAISLARTAEFFQDAPFSFPYTYQALDQYFPQAKFILTVRNNAEEWYTSLTQFHGKRFGREGRVPPSSEDLKEATYITKGNPYHIHKILYSTADSKPYEKKFFLNYYQNHIAEVTEYFRHKKEKLLIINLSQKEDYSKLCTFLDIKPKHDGFPWLNKT
jgi:hypothetical protein